MRKLTLLTLLAVTLAVPLQAQRGKNQSYFSYDDGGTIVRQGEDGREIEGRINLPVFPGDEVTTNRRGRAEVRMSDGNVVGIDRASAVVFRSVLDSYDGDNEETVIELRYGKVGVYRTNDVRDSIRLDTPSATYFAGNEAVFSVESDTRGNDRVNVFEGTIEVRTPSRTTRLRRSETASIDDRGLYSLASDAQDSADDFERWFLRRSEKWGNATSRYLDRSIAYYDEDLSRHGSWITIGTYGSVWRPYGISSSWRPYYYGHWTRGRSGALVWVSYEPWGWAPYHYGRWAHDPYYGWFWVPGTGYAPAWVYWWYGPGYLGWAPAGWYDCYPKYYDWAYRPYHRAGLDFGFGFYGRVRVKDVDLRPWTFIDGNTIVSNRVDRAALTTDIVRNRLHRDGGDNGFATISGGPARFTRADMKDPVAAINRRFAGAGGVERGSGGGSGGQPTDMTPFFRRDPDLNTNVRDRITRTRPADGGTRAAAPTSPAVPSTRGGDGGETINRGGLAPVGGGSVAPIGGGGLAPIGGSGSDAGDTGARMRDRTDIPRTDIGSGRIDRGDSPRNNNTGDSGRTIIDEGGRVVRAPATPDAPRSSGDWRDRVGRTTTPRDEQPATRTPDARTSEPRQNTQPAGDWRTRVVRDAGSGSRDSDAAPRTESSEPSRSRSGGNRDSDVSRRVIDRIGGARVTPSGESERPRSTSSGSRDSERRERSADRPSRDSSPPPRAEQPRSNDGGSSRSTGSSDSGGSSRGNSSGGSRSSGGRIKRN